MLGSVLRNVLKNAVQHNRSDDPTVTAGVETDAETVSVRLADGVLDEQQEAIFDRGERGMSSGGIGPYLVRTLVNQYGGRVWVDDDSTGAVFVVEFERRQWFSAAAPILPV